MVPLLCASSLCTLCALCALCACCCAMCSLGSIASPTSVYHDQKQRSYSLACKPRIGHPRIDNLDPKLPLWDDLYDRYRSNGRRYGMGDVYIICSRVQQEGSDGCTVLTETEIRVLQHTSMVIHWLPDRVHQDGIR